VAENLERHHRTALLLTTLANLSVSEAAGVLDGLRFGIAIDDDAARTPAGQAAALTAASVLGRLGGAVYLEVPAVSLVLRGTPWDGQVLDEACATIVQWAGGRLSQKSGVARLAVGLPPASSAIAVGGGDWIAEVDGPRSLMEGNHPLGAMAAVHLGAGRLFHLALGAALNLPTIRRDPAKMSLLTYGLSASARTSPSRIKAAHSVALVGAGAVGQAVAWSAVVGQVRLADRVDIIDPQILDVPNLNRHVCSGREDVGRFKAEIVSGFFATSGVEAVPFRLRIGEYLADRGVLPIAISTVDNNEARYELQGTFPSLIFHGATSQEHLSAAALDPTNGACLGCLFPRRSVSSGQAISDETGIPVHLVEDALGPAGVMTREMLEPIAFRMGLPAEALHHLANRNFREVYATEICGRLTAPGIEPTAAPTVAYASGLAGLLLTAEMAKNSTPLLRQWRLRNYVQLSALNPESAWVASREKDLDCPLMCSSPALQSYLARRSRTT